MGLNPVKIELGEVEVKEKLSEKQQKQLSTSIKKAGLELIKSKDGILTDQIKACIIEYIDNINRIKNNLSDYLAEKLNYDYAYLSSYFSAMQATTIEQYTIALKIERIKEMLVLDDLTLTEISYKLNYSSVAHLSNQFKKVTGLPPSHFKKLKIIRRKTIQQL
ncbi:MAG TPA: AraC family transcriptional regulator [Panacibacter sp.]|nr:AraC family transcriptional regulator [Panacibacter sp.]